MYWNPEDLRKEGAIRAKIEYHRKKQAEYIKKLVRLNDRVYRRRIK